MVCHRQAKTLAKQKPWLCSMLKAGCCILRDLLRRSQCIHGPARGALELLALQYIPQLYIEGSDCGFSLAPNFVPKGVYAYAMHEVCCMCVVVQSWQAQQEAREKLRSIVAPNATCLIETLVRRKHGVVLEFPYGNIQVGAFSVKRPCITVKRQVGGTRTKPNYL